MKNKKPMIRGRLLLAYLGTLATMLACVATAVGTDPDTSEPNSNVPIQLENGVVEVRDENGGWTNVSETSTFDLTAELESTDPWKVAGMTLETDDATVIEDGLQTGDLVRAQGLILEDGSWLASSIQRAEGQIDPVIILVGKVDSVDPWMVNGIQLNVTEDTEIQGTITPGMFRAGGNLACAGWHLGGVAHRPPG